MIFIFLECVLSVVVLIVVACCDGQTTHTRPKQPEIKVDVHVNVPPQEPPHPTIAEQFDGRLTNIVKDPLQGIL